jgi:hypothetical protein
MSGGPGHRIRIGGAAPELDVRAAGVVSVVGALGHAGAAHGHHAIDIEAMLHRVADHDAAIRVGDNRDVLGRKTRRVKVGDQSLQRLNTRISAATARRLELSPAAP